MKKLISALMLAALASGSLMMTEGQSLAAGIHGKTKARHTMVSKRKHKTPGQKTIRKAKKATKKAPVVRKRRSPSKKRVSKVGKIVRVRKGHSRKVKPVSPASDGNGTLPISQ